MPKSRHQSQRCNASVLSPTSIRCLPLLLCILFTCADATIKLMIGDDYPTELGSVITEFRSEPANFGLPFNTSVEYKADLFMPFSDEFFCGGRYDRLMREILGTVGDSQTERVLLDNDLEETSFLGEGKSVLETKHHQGEEDISIRFPNRYTQEIKKSNLRQRRQESIEPVKSLALLVSRGQCSFESKARTAMAFNEHLNEIFQGRSPVRLNYLIVHNDIVGDRNQVLMAGPKTGVDVGLVFVTTSVGYRLKTLLLKVGQKQDASPFLQKSTLHRVYNDDTNSGVTNKKLFEFPIVIRNDFGDNGGRTTNDSARGFQFQSFYWVRFILFSMLIVTPVFRLVFLWYSAGGRICFRRTSNGCIYGLRIVRPRQRWVNVVGWRDQHTGSYDDDRHGNGGKLTEEQVMSLPQIEYSANNDEEGGDTERSVSQSTGPSGVEKDNYNRSGEDASHAADTIVVSNTTNVRDRQIEPTEIATTSCTMCSICIDDFEPGEMIRVLPRCRHGFHTDCILPWLTERQGCCPLCKTPVLGDETAESSPDESVEMVAIDRRTFISPLNEGGSGMQIPEESNTHGTDDATNVQQSSSPDYFENEELGTNVQLTSNQNAVSDNAGIVGVRVMAGGRTAALTTTAVNERITPESVSTDEIVRDPLNDNPVGLSNDEADENQATSINTEDDEEQEKALVDVDVCEFSEKKLSDAVNDDDDNDDDDGGGVSSRDTNISTSARYDEKIHPDR